MAASLFAYCSQRVAAEGLLIGKPCEVSPELPKANQRWPSIAAGTNCYLVVWQDGDIVWGGDADIYAARLSVDGKPLDPKPIPICTTKGHQAYPSVTFDGITFVVAWSDFRSGKDWDVYAARVTLEGKVLDADGFAVAAVFGNQAYAAVASDGKGATLVIWSDIRPRTEKPQTEVYALFGTLLKDGKPLENGGREMKRAAGSLLAPSVVWDGANYQCIAAQAGTGWDLVSSAVTVSRDGKPQPSRLSAWATYSLAADPETKRMLIWTNRRQGHGGYSARYAVGIFTDGGKDSVRAQLLGLERAWAPTNDMWSAATFNGKSFVAVVEQNESCDLSTAGIFKSLPAGVNLVATRIDPVTAKPLDAGWFDPGHGNADKEATEKDHKEAKGPPIAIAEAKVKLRHPALASCGNGKAVLVYSRHGGVDQFKIYAILMGE